MENELDWLLEGVEEPGLEQEFPARATLPELPAYEFTPDGRVFRVVPTKQGFTGEMRTHVDKRKGYIHIRLRDVDGKRQSYWMQRLICRAFHGEPVGARCFARHLDGNPSNNRAFNLQWGTQEENERDKWK